MELTEPIDSINKQLIELFGIDTASGDAMFRVVWSEDQYEHRLMETNDAGLFLLHPEVRLVPKYNQWVKNKHVLERLVVIPEVSIRELPATKVSYEILWVFEDKHGNALPPALWAAKFAIDCVYAAMGKKSMAKYVDEAAKNPQEYREKRVRQIEEELFGNETPVGDALAYGTGVTVNKERKSR